MKAQKYDQQSRLARSTRDGDVGDGGSAGVESGRVDTEKRARTYQRAVLNRENEGDAVLNRENEGDAVLNRENEGDAVLNRENGGDAVLNRENEALQYDTRIAKVSFALERTLHIARDGHVSVNQQRVVEGDAQFSTGQKHHEMGEAHELQTQAKNVSKSQRVRGQKGYASALATAGYTELAQETNISPQQQPQQQRSVRSKMLRGAWRLATCSAIAADVRRMCVLVHVSYVYAYTYTHTNGHCPGACSSLLM